MTLDVYNDTTIVTRILTYKKKVTIKHPLCYPDITLFAIIVYRCQIHLSGKM